MRGSERKRKRTIQGKKMKEERDKVILYNKGESERMEERERERESYDVENGKR